MTMSARLKFLPASPAGVEGFARMPRNFAGRPGRCFGWELEVGSWELVVWVHHQPL